MLNHLNNVNPHDQFEYTTSRWKKIIQLAWTQVVIPLHQGMAWPAKIWVAIMYGDFKWEFNYMMGIGHNPFQEIQEKEMKQSSPKKPSKITSSIRWRNQEHMNAKEVPKPN